MGGRQACPAPGPSNQIANKLKHLAAVAAVTATGANGAGKTTLLKGIAGIEPLAGGRMLLDGSDCSQVPAHKRVGLGPALSPEGRGVFADQTVHENLLVEQMANQALAGADRACVLETGHITGQGTGKDMLNDPKLRAAYLESH